MFKRTKKYQITANKNRIFTKWNAILFCFFVLSSLLCNSQNTNKFDKYNNPHLGLQVEDFSFVTTKDDNLHTLYNIKADSLIIFFYDPDCSHCKKEIKKLRKDKHLNNLIAQDSIVFMTIPPDIDLDYWVEFAKKLPKNWINAYLEEKDLLTKKFLWKVPEMFHLDKNKQVMQINMYKEEIEDE